MGKLWNTWWRSRSRRSAQTGRIRPSAHSGHHLTVEHLEDRSVPAVTLTNTSLDFGFDPVGVINPSPRATTVLNTDPNNVLVSVTSSGANAADFTVLSGPTIGQPLTTTPQSFRFAFTPSTQGSESAAYSIDTTDGTLIVSLTGTGTSPISLTASSLDFGSVATGTPSPSVRSTSLLNQDPNNVLLSITASGPNAADFQLVAAPTVGQPLSVGIPQAFRFGFTPTTVGAESATFTINTTDGALTVNLIGTGASSESLTTSSLDFGSILLGTPSPSVRSSSILNQDPNNILLGITASGPNAADFQIVAAPTVGQPLSTLPTTSTLRFGFTPTTTGTESATYTLNTTDGVLTITLTGTGASPENLTASSLNFGSVVTGTPSPSVRSASIVNQDPNNVLLGITASGPNAADFQLVASPTVGQPLSVGIPQAFRFGFTPTTVGTESATYTITTTDGTLVISLTGTGTSPATLTSPNLNFGSVTVGTASPSVRSTSILNQNPNNVLLSIIASGPNASDFELVAAPTVGQPLPNNATLRFSFTPTTTGTESATYTLNTTDGPLVITLTGTGASSAPPTLSLNHSSVSFGNVPQGIAAPPLGVGLWNFAQNVQLLGISSNSPHAADFPLLTSFTPGQLIPVATSSTTASMNLQFGFVPSTIGNESVTYTIQTSAGNITVTLTGTGISPVTLNHSSVAFGNAPQGTSATPEGVGIWNYGQNVQILSVTSNSPQAADFQLLTPVTTGQTLPVATSPTSPSLNLQFGFTPSTIGNESATYTIATTAGNYVVTLTGTGISPVSLNHSSIAFGNVPQGVGAPPLGVGIWNYGQNVQILSVTSNSPQAADFQLLTPVTSGQTLPVATSPTSPSLNLQFGFTPSTIGNESVTYTIATTAGNFVVTLTGTGISPVSLNHSSVAFGNVVEGTSATPLGVGIWNYGQNVQILSVFSNSPHAGDFPLLTPVTAGQVLPQATSSTSPSLNLQFGFAPSTIGNESATYTIQTSDGSFTVTLTGTGTSPLSLSRSSLDFGSNPVGTGAQPLSVSLWNFGQNVQILGVSSTSPLAGDFPLLTPVTSGQTLAVAQPVTATSSGTASLSLQFGFVPSTFGTESATYTIQTTAGNLTLTLTGTGVSSISLSTTSLDFGSVPVGTPSQVQTTTLLNQDPNNVLQSVTFSGANPHDFVLLPGPTVGQPLGTGAIPFSFGFIPSTIGSESATVTIQTTDGTVTLNLTGTGTSPISLSTTSLDFGAVPEDSPAPPQTATLQNLDPNNVLQSVTFSGANPNDFVLLPGPFTIGQPLGAGSIPFSFGFIPSTIGSESATVTIQTTDGSLTLNLTGTGTSPINLSTTSLDFGSVTIGTPAPSQTATLQNFDPNNVLQSVTLSGANPNDFVLLSGPSIGQPLGAGTTQFSFGFIPSTVGSESATVTIQTTDGSLTLNLTGTGVSGISLSPTSLDFGPVLIGTTTQVATVFLQNQDPNNVLQSITTSGANSNDFQLVSGPSIGQPLGAGSPQLLYTFTPSTLGVESATVTIQTTEGTATLNLTGTGANSLSLSPASLDFGSVPVGTPASTPLTTTLQNLDPNNVLLSVTMGGANPNDFQLVAGPVVGQPVGAGSQFLYTFTPSTLGAESATVTIQTTDGTATLNLTGTGSSPISLSPTSLNFGSVPFGTTATTQLVATLQNLDPNNSLLSVTMGGANPNDFQLVAGAPLGLIGAGSEQFLYSFTPSTIGAESATVTFHTTDGDVVLNLTGTGTTPLLLDATSLAFGADPEGVTNPSPRSTALVNQDPNNVLLSVTAGGANPGDFTLLSGPTVGSTLSVGVQTFRFAFTPSTIGSESATYTITTTDGTEVVTLTGQGTSPISLASPNLAFGSVPEGVTNSSPRSTALLNQDPNNVLMSVTPGGTNPGDFTLLSGPTVGSTLGVGEQSFRFAFTPSTSAAESATYTITTTDGTVVIHLSGSGTTPISLASPSLAFGTVPVGVTNPSPRSTALVNQDPNNVLLSVTAGGANPGDFTLLSGPAVGSTLGVGPQSFRFAFTPTTLGNESATYTIVTTDGTEVIHLSGSGTTPISLASTSLAFGSVPVGVTNPSPRSAALLNLDPNNVLLSVTAGGANPGDFTLLSGPAAGSTLGVGPQSFRFAFTPTTLGNESATYTIVTTDGTEVIHLSGSGTTPISLASPNLAFGSVKEGTTNPSPRSTALLNQDPNNVLLSVTAGGANPGDFTLLSGPAVGSTLGVGPQSFRFAFTPTTLGNESATYTIVTTDGTVVVNLSGKGVANVQPATVSLSHSSLAFGKVTEGTTAAPLSVGIWNFGQNVQLLGVTSSSPQAADFQLLTAITSGQLIPVAQSVAGDPQGSPSLNLQFAFTPSTVGGESATYTIETSAGNFTITLTGTGTSPVSLSHSSLSFGAVPTGTAAAPLSMGVWNFGQNVKLLGVTSSSPQAADFQLLTAITTGQLLPVAQSVAGDPQGSSSLNLQFAFTPSTVGNESATYTIETSAGNFNITLTGTGTSPVSLSHSLLEFGKVVEGTAAAPLSVGVWNFGQNVKLLGVTSSSPQAADFQLLTAITTGQLLPVAQSVAGDPQGPASLNLQFAFTPSTVGNESATYTIATSAGNFTITLTGTGTSPVSLSHSSVSFGKVTEGTTAAPLSVGIWNFGQNVQLLGVSSSSPQAADFQLLTAITPGELLSVAQSVAGDPQGSPSLSLQFAFTPSTVGVESATFTIATSAGDFTVTLTGTGTPPVSLSHSSMNFGPVTVGSPSAVLSVGVWNFGQNVKLLGITSTSPQAADFQLLTATTPGELLPVSQSVAGDPQGSSSLNLQFVFTPSTTGSETTTYIIHTSAGDLTLTLTGTGV